MISPRCGAGLLNSRCRWSQRKRDKRGHIAYFREDRFQGEDQFSLQDPLGNRWARCIALTKNRSCRQKRNRGEILVRSFRELSTGEEIVNPPIKYRVFDLAQIATFKALIG